MKEKEKSPSGRGEYSAGEIAWYEARISVIKGLISYHERMVIPLQMTTAKQCERDFCPAIAFENDVYLDALKEALRLMEIELGRLRG